jgi:hypothetical protein
MKLLFLEKFKALVGFDGDDYSSINIEAPERPDSVPLGKVLKHRKMVKKKEQKQKQKRKKK